MDFNISAIWEELEGKASDGQDAASRVYRALGQTAVGIRAGFLPRERILELLIEVPPTWENAKSLPEWRGMRFEMLPLPLPPREEAHQLQLYLVDHEHKAVFLTFCEDLVTALEKISDAEIRVREIEECIARWSRFFEKSGPSGLTFAAQRGLFAELKWIQNMISTGIDIVETVSSWKGCERAYHDFDLNGDIVEVKSTMSKEPRSVRISNERQLDGRGLRSLHLFVLTLHSMEGGGVTLPNQVQMLRDALSPSATVLSKFERCLVSMGYLEKHAIQYDSHYTVKKQELFEVTESFPRIIDVPSGVGHLRYSVTVSACQQHEVQLPAYLAGLRAE